ncbi:serine-rich adhesin for platelets-like isoform X2 [Schistocerca nitens]|uniref:serine-rich adhesin for platelets-like isoform X2 n=1 Tax=Schistocerca nitens TaxID=7011 RepID=UPI0021197B55|nr:serine-rich adhesin for platelets-like isoform X2 [Schistocerca nitens]
MCSLAAMPEVLVSHSPPDYFYRSRYTPPPPPKTAPTRPCLASPPPRAAKKKVVFADDKGYSLTQVRVMREPSNAPPTWSLQFLAQVMRDLEPAAVAAAANEAASVPSAASSPAAVTASEPERWVPEFAQPASDYLQFRERLDSGNVSLENVIVRDAEGVFTGTVKVRNLDFHKEVQLRWTADGWKTYTDERCSYVENQVACSSAYVLYDTFSFRVSLPPANPRDESPATSSSSSSSSSSPSSTSSPASATPASSSDSSSASSSSPGSTTCCSASSSSPASDASSSAPSSSPAPMTPCSSSASDTKATTTTTTTTATTTTAEPARLQEPSRRVEFCVCFRCGGREYWDSNGGANYALVRRAPVVATPAPAAAPAAVAVASVPAGAGPGPAQGAGKFRDALHAKLDSWSEFASWNHLVTEGPYW